MSQLKSAEKRKLAEEKKKLIEEERMKKKEEIRLKKEEERKLKEEERLKKMEERQRQQEERQRQQEEKQKQQEERQRLKDEKKRQQEEELKKKEEEKKVKESERLKKLEEKQKQQEEKQKQIDEKLRQKEEKKRQEEDELKKKEKEKEKFLGFFKKPSDDPNRSSSQSSQLVINGQSEATGPFLAYQPKPNETLAEIVPQFVKDNFCKGAFDSLFEGQYESEELYLNELKQGKVQPTKTGRKLRICSKKPSDPDVIILKEGPDSPAKSMPTKTVTTTVFKGKLLQFHDNIRPAWFGTWNKTSCHVRGRRPFGTDTKYFDYEVDSDDEWEDPGPGESIAGSDDEKDDPEDDYEIDNEFMVPHGYLSDSEEKEINEEENAEGDGDVNFREKEMISRKNMKVNELKPISIGCFWQSKMDGQDAAYHVLKKYRMVFNYSLKE